MTWAGALHMHAVIMTTTKTKTLKLSIETIRRLDLHAVQGGLMPRPSMGIACSAYSCRCTR
jgi:hypothetical protein